MGKMIFCKTLIFLSVTTFVGSVFASESNEKKWVKVNRYSHIYAAPKKMQEDILSVVLEITFPDTVTTVGGAVDRLLHVSGYRVGKGESETSSQYYLFMLPLPDIHRTLGPIELKDALVLLGGNGFELVVDRTKRKVFYQLKNKDTRELTSKEISEAKVSWYGRFIQREEPVINVQCEGESFARLSYGPVRNGESLLNIAHLHTPDGLTIEQTLMSIFHLNPHAFLHKNINYLISGVILSIPCHAEIARFSYQDAKVEVWKHYDKWMVMEK